MVVFNYSTRELTTKVVFYGPGLCGKTTNLQFIYDHMPQGVRGKMLSLATKSDRTLFFDFLPIELGTIRGVRTRIQIYTVPGQVFYESTRRMVLKGCDAVVFVADSQAAMLDANAESLRSLRQNLLLNEIDPTIPQVPLVVLDDLRDRRVDLVREQVLVQAPEALRVRVQHRGLAVGDEHDRVRSREHHPAGGVVLHLPGHGVELDLEVVAGDGPQAEGQEVEEELSLIHI